MIVNLSGSKIWAYFGGFCFLRLKSYRNDILVTSFWQSMNRNNRPSLITGAQTISYNNRNPALGVLWSWREAHRTPRVAIIVTTRQFGRPSTWLLVLLSVAGPNIVLLILQSLYRYIYHPDRVAIYKAVPFSEYIKVTTRICIAIVTLLMKVSLFIFIFVRICFIPNPTYGWGYRLNIQCIWFSTKGGG